MLIFDSERRSLDAAALGPDGRLRALADPSADPVGLKDRGPAFGFFGDGRLAAGGEKGRVTVWDVD